MSEKANDTSPEKIERKSNLQKKPARVNQKKK